MDEETSTWCVHRVRVSDCDNLINLRSLFLIILFPVIIDRVSIFNLLHNPIPSLTISVGFQQRTETQSCMTSFHSPPHARFLVTLSNVLFVYSPNPSLTLSAQKSIEMGVGIKIQAALLSGTSGTWVPQLCSECCAGFIPPFTASIPGQTTDFASIPWWWWSSHVLIDLGLDFIRCRGFAKMDGRVIRTGKTCCFPR